MPWYRSAWPVIFCKDTAYIPLQFLMKQASTPIIESLEWVPNDTNWSKVLANVTSCIWNNPSKQSPNTH